MKTILAVIILSAAAWAQNGGALPAPDISGSVVRMNEAASRSNEQAASAELMRQQAALLKQQTKALQQQNELRKQQQSAALAAQAYPPPSRKPRIDDIDLATGKPKFASYADYEDAKDEWLIEEAVRRFQAMPAAH